MQSKEDDDVKTTPLLKPSRNEKEVQANTDSDSEVYVQQRDDKGMFIDNKAIMHN